MVRNLITFKCVGQLLGDFDQKSDIIFVFVTMYLKDDSNCRSRDKGVQFVGYIHPGNR